MPLNISFRRARTRGRPRRLGWVRGQAAHVGGEGGWGGDRGKKPRNQGGSRASLPHSPPTEGEEVGGGQSAGSAGSAGKHRGEQRGRPDPEQERDPGEGGGQAGSRVREGRAVREGGTGRDREKSVSLGRAALSSASTGFPAQSLTDPWSSLRPAPLL